jgi:hypothetical protein
MNVEQLETSDPRALSLKDTNLKPLICNAIHNLFTGHNSLFISLESFTVSGSM